MKKVLIVLVVLAIGGFAGFVAIQPDAFTITRTATIAAPADVVYPMVSDFHAWTGWSPWEALDPKMKKTYEGAPGAVGSSYAWVGGDKTGEGKMTILTAKASESLSLKLEFIKPFAAINETIFTFAPSGAGTTVTWKMQGHSSFVSKAFGVFLNMDKLVGGDFDKGLAKMKELAEAETKKRGAPEAAPTR